MPKNKLIPPNSLSNKRWLGFFSKSSQRTHLNRPNNILIIDQKANIFSLQNKTKRHFYYWPT